MAITFIDKIESSNPEAFAIIDATEVGGHKTVKNYSDLAHIPTAILTPKGDYSDADGQLWYVLNDDAPDANGNIAHSKGFYQLTVSFIGSHSSTSWDKYSAGEGSLTYKPGVDGSVGTVAVGGLPKDTLASSLNVPISEVLDMILFPTQIPTPGANPSISVIYSDKFKASSVILVIGDDILKSEDIKSVAFTQGKVNNYDGKQKDDGTQKNGNYTVAVKKGSSSLSNIESVTSTSPETFTYTISQKYTDGDKFPSNKGLDAGFYQRKAGTATTTKTVNYTKPWFATTENENTITRQKLIAWDNTENSMKSNTSSGNPGNDIEHLASGASQTIYLPRDGKIETWDNISGKWADVTSDYTKSTCYLSFNATDTTATELKTSTPNTVTYTKYVFGAERGDYKFRVIF